MIEILEVHSPATPAIPAPKPYRHRRGSGTTDAEVLALLDGRSQAQVAHELGITKPSLHGRLHRMRDRGLVWRVNPSIWLPVGVVDPVWRWDVEREQFVVVGVPE